jgi:hypothetical protein
VRNGHTGSVYGSDSRRARARTCGICGANNVWGIMLLLLVMLLLRSVNRNHIIVVPPGAAEAHGNHDRRGRGLVAVELCQIRARDDLRAQHRSRSRGRGRSDRWRVSGQKWRRVGQARR